MRRVPRVPFGVSRAPRATSSRRIIVVSTLPMLGTATQVLSGISGRRQGERARFRGVSDVARKGTIADIKANAFRKFPDVRFLLYICPEIGTYAGDVDTFPARTPTIADPCWLLSPSANHAARR